MSLMGYRALPEKERALFLFGSLFDKEECQSVFALDARHAETFKQLNEVVEGFSKELQSLVLLSLLSEVSSNI